MLATILKERRLALNLTQQAVADQLHTTRQTISNWETGKNYPDVPMLIAISELYSLTIDDMLKADDDYVQQVSDDYQLIKQIKQSHVVDWGLGLSLGTLLVILIVHAFFPAVLTESMSGLLTLSVAVVLIGFSYFKTRQFYPIIPHAKQPLIIPKPIGVGLTINPNHPLGKVIWVLIILFLVGGLIPMIFK